MVPGESEGKKSRRRVCRTRGRGRLRRKGVALVVALLAVVAAPPVGAAAQEMAAASPGSAAAAQPDDPAPEERSIRAVRPPEAPPEIDGSLGDPAWEHADVATDFVQFEPDPGAEPSQPTEVRILYTDEAVFVGARMFDSSPDSIVARLARRDEHVVSDRFLVGFDSYYDRRTAFAFAVTAGGAESDFLLYDDTNEDRSWDAVWDVATRIDGQGWTAEFRIPLSQLRFSVEDGEEGIWGVNFQRDITRHEEEDLWSPFPEDRSRMVSAFGTLRGMSGIEPSRHLEVRPYTVLEATDAPGDAANPFHEPMEYSGTLGGDVSYGLTPNLTLNATINPDFGQVEADPSVVNLSAFETFFPEKRPFFQEGSDIFQFDIGLGDGSSEKLFYSRRIGRSPRGSAPLSALYSEGADATTILGAAKLSGKTSDGWSLGFMDAVTGNEFARYVTAEGERGERRIEPRTNYGVARVIKDFDEGESAVGGIFTAMNRSVDPGGGLGWLPTAAYTGGVDVRHRFGDGDYQVSGYALGSHVRGSQDAIASLQRSSRRYYQRPDADHVEFDPTRTALTGGSASFALRKMGGKLRGALMTMARTPGFEVNPMGFQREADQLTQAVWLGYQEYDPGPVFRRWNLNLNQYSGWTFGGERNFVGTNLNGSFQLNNYWSGYGGAEHMFSSYSTAALRGGPSLYRPARFNSWFGVHSDSRKAVRFGFNGNYTVIPAEDGRRLSLGPSLSVQPSSRMSLSMSPRATWNRTTTQYVQTVDAEAGTRYVLGQLDQTTVSLTTRLGYTFTPELSLQLYAQPFVSAGEYSRFKEVVSPKATAFDDRFRTFGEDQVRETDAGYEVDRDGDGTAEMAFRDPNFNIRQFRSNLVLRWEYRPGSTLFVVWSQDRSGFAPTGDFEFGRDVDQLFDAPARNVFLVKMEYWLGM